MPGSAFTVDTPLVPLAVTTDGGAVTEIRLNQRGARAAASDLERRVEGELREYFGGRRSTFTFPIAPEGTAFERQVWDELAKIPYGKTRSYGEIAALLGRPGAARAVGAANGKNPIPIVVPCHRVVATGGKLGGYGGGPELKRQLLDLEMRHAMERFEEPADR